MVAIDVSNVNVRVDSKTKESAEEIFEEMGINMTSAINMFLKQTVREKRLPFSVDLNPLRAETIKVAEEGVKIANDPNGKGYISIEDFKKALGL